MTPHTLSISWHELARPGVTVLRSDGSFEETVEIKHLPNRVRVLYVDGRREEHAPSEQARILLRGS